MHDCAETRLAFDNGVRHTHLAAQRGQVDDKLNGVDIVRDKNERGLLGLDKRDDVVETIFDGVRLLANILLFLALRDSGRLLMQTLLLLSRGLWAVLVHKFEQLGSGVAVERMAKLGERRWYFEAHVQDLALALQADVLGPSHHA